MPLFTTILFFGGGGWGVQSTSHFYSLSYPILALEKLEANTKKYKKKKEVLIIFFYITCLLVFLLVLRVSLMA